MANEIGTAYINIQPSADGIGGNIEKTITPGAKVAGATAGTAMAGTMATSLKTTGARLMKGGAIVTALAVPLVAGIKTALSAYEQQMIAEAKLAEIYKTRLGATEDQIQATLELASAQQKLGVVGDEVQIAGAQQLATFVSTTDSVNALIPAMNNLLVQQNGLNATQGDATQIANLFGKALQGQTGALRRVGISFNEAQEEVLKYGTEEEKVAMLAEVIEQNVGNMNKAIADTPLGKIQQAKNAFGDLKEEIGAQLAPVVSSLATWMHKNLVPAIQKFIAFMQKHPIIAKFAVALTGVLLVGGPLLILLGSLIGAIGTIAGVLGAISAPIVAVVAGIGAVIAVLVVAYQKSESFRTAVQTLGGAIKTFLGGAIEFIRPILSALWALFQQIAKVVGVVLTPIVTALGQAFQVAGNIFSWVGQKLQPLANVIRNIGSAFNTVKGWIVSAGREIKSVGQTIAKPFVDAWSAIKGAYDKITGIFPIRLGKIFEGIKLPHFKISGGEIPWGIGGYGKRPSIDIEWYAKGGIMRKPTIFGGGEAGAEAIVPLEPFWDRLDKMNTGNEITINVYAPEGMDIAELSREIERRIIASTQRREYAWR